MNKSLALVSSLALMLTGCGGGGGSPSSAVTPPPPPPPPTNVFQVPAQQSLSVADVQTVIAQAVQEAQARNQPSAIAVVDRVGNVLAVFVMGGANLALGIPNLPTPVVDSLPGLNVPAPGGVAGAIAKAITGAYLSSGGNAFSSRTASQIVQQHFPPAPTTVGLESGPLYGVQFSQLPCSDLSARFVAGGGPGALIGPKRSPLGLSADAGGFPLYKNGVLVGGVGVLGDGLYSFDNNILDRVEEHDEGIALAATRGFEAPESIRANRISVDGTTLRYSDIEYSELKSTGPAPSFASINGTVGNLAPVRGYSANAVVPGVAYGTEESGIRAASAAEFSNPDAFILTNGTGTARYPVRGGTDGGSISQPLSQAEARAILEEAFKIMSRARAQIRQPLDSRAQVTISLVDTHGSILGMVRSPDAPIFGIDVSLQKARTSAFFSGSFAAAELLANPNTRVADYVARARTFFNDPAALTGKVAFGDRTIGNLARPFFPDGEAARAPGPFSPPIQSFSPFNTGLQSDLIVGNILAHANFLLNGGTDTPQRCTRMPDVVAGQNRLQNGIQIFPGAVPVYRGNVLVGAVGVSGDGIDQDDMIAFLGTHNGGARVTGVGNAPEAVRADQVVVTLADKATVRLRYVSCPFAPFLDTTDQNVCQGR